MRNKWLAFLIMGSLTLVTFIFFALRVQPIKIPVRDENQTAQPGSLETPTVTFLNPVKGAADAKITIVEFGDFECQPCAELKTALEVVLAAYPQDVRVVWKHFPNESLHRNATDAAIASQCAAKQGAFWQYHDALFARATLSKNVYAQIVGELELNAEAFAKCTESQDTLPIVRKDFEEGLALGLTATPTLFVGEERIVGAVSADELLLVVERQLNE